MVCIDCSRPVSRGSKGRCLQCYFAFRKNNPKLITCKRCHRPSKDAGHKLCRRCYNKQPKLRKYFSQYERRARSLGLRKETEKLRSQSPKRKLWKRRYQKVYYAKNREHLLKYQQKYRQDFQRQTIYKQRRRHRLRNLPATLTPAEWQELLVLHEQRCYYCKTSSLNLEAEHRLPASRGGGYTKENIVPACGRCNRRKKDMTEDEFRQFLIEVGERPLF